MKQKSFFQMGFRGMLPITTGIIPFGAVMGTVTADAHLSFFQSTVMNILVFAGASQLAAVDLMTKNAAVLVVVITGLIINLRFILYSAAMSPFLQKSPFWIKFFCAYSLTDQNYAVMSAHQDKLKTAADSVQFYIGASLCMTLVWHSSVILGFVFGNFAPPSFALDFAVPLSFVALVIPTIRNRKYFWVAAFSSVVSLLLQPLPYRMGLIVTALLAIGFATALTRKRVVS